MKNLKILILIATICTYNVIASTVPRVANETEEDELVIEDLSQYNNFQNDVLEKLLNANDNNAYWLFTRKNPITPQIIVNGDAISLWTSNYDGSKPLKVIAHGWGRDGTSPVNTMITSAFLDVSDVNVIVVDWRDSASGNYVSASVSVPAAGRFLGNFLQWLIRTGGGNWDNVHLIGYSLGAHLVGNAGREVGGQPIRVTGLDPAGPFWSNPFALNKNSGRYVEAIHTNILARGITEPIAHVDFYPNGGQMQPGCDTNQCSHSRSYMLFASSIRTNHFIGRECADLWQAVINQCYGRTFNMGNGNLSKKGSGIYAVNTRSSWPF
ncbi:pancreatic lipase-related protein 2-like [Vanessa cardui]|uniref:pancreatic lipase-related protein 2-like n=1 Tax=Vanessa cardui TaxID=171605 RepID=UPI001F137214|nr:pancreatic lipase-related protein 2-like [Vanessa cardui]